MPVAARRHKEKRNDGKPVFIIHPLLKDSNGEFTNKVNTRFSGKRAHVEFHDGVGRTVFAERALALMETNGYLVELPEGFDIADLGYVQPRKAKTADPLEEPAPDYVLEDDEDEDDEEEEDDDDE